MTIGTTAVAATLMGAGVATATLAQESPKRGSIGAPATTPPAVDAPAEGDGLLRLPAAPATAIGGRLPAAGGAHPTSRLHRPAQQRSAQQRSAQQRSAQQRSAPRGPRPRTSATQAPGRRPAPHRSAARRPGKAGPAAAPPARPQNGGPVQQPADTPAAPRPTPTRVPDPVVPSATEEPSSSASDTITDILPIPFPTRWIEDRSMRRGTREVRTPGEPGIRTRTFVVTTVDGRETDRRLVSDRVTRKPVTRVVAVGARRDSCGAGYEGCPTPDRRCPDGSTGGPATRLSVRGIADVCTLTGTG